MKKLTLIKAIPHPNMPKVMATTFDESKTLAISVLNSGWVELKGEFLTVTVQPSWIAYIVEPKADVPVIGVKESIVGQRASEKSTTRGRKKSRAKGKP